MNTRFSVITITYNAELQINKTICSILGQSLCPYEYIIIDGKSEDSTLDIVNEYKSAFFCKGIQLRIVSERDGGIYNAMNKGIDYATGDYISFLNAGDWYEIDTLSKVNMQIEISKCDFLYGGINYIKNDGTVTKKKSRLDKYIISTRNWNHPSMFLKSSIYKCNKFNETYKVYADFDLYLKLRNENVRICVCNDILTNFVADGVSTKVNIHDVLDRCREKYTVYRRNGYGRLYFIETYMWEILKSLYLVFHKKRT